MVGMYRITPLFSQRMHQVCTTAYGNVKVACFGYMLMTFYQEELHYHGSDAKAISRFKDMTQMSVLLYGVDVISKSRSVKF